MSHKITIVESGYLDDNDTLLTRREVNERITLKDKRIAELEAAIRFANTKVRDWENSNKSTASYRLCVAFDALDRVLNKEQD